MRLHVIIKQNIMMILTVDYKNENTYTDIE